MARMLCGEKSVCCYTLTTRKLNGNCTEEVSSFRCSAVGALFEDFPGVLQMSFS